MGFSVVAVGLLSGCGGSSSGGSSSGAVTGYLIDSAVAGIEYNCGSTTGLTGQTGAFSCNSFPISFQLGALSLGVIDSLPTDTKIFPQDLAGLSRSSTSNTKVLNIAQLLQSLDEDNNPSNGILIASATRAKFTQVVNIQEQTQTDIENHIKNAGKTVISRNSAKSHLECNTPGVVTQCSSSSNSSSSSSLSSNSSTTNAPTLTTTPTHTNQNSLNVEVNGAVGAAVFVNGVNTNQTINTNGKVTIALNTSGADGVKSFALRLKEGSGNQSTALNVNITKDTVAPTKFSWVYGLFSTGDFTQRRVSFDENISQSGVSLTPSSNGIVSNIAVDNQNITFDYQKINTDENLTIQGTDLAGNDFNITQGTKVTLKTGQTTSYAAYDDGYYQKGVDRSFTRDDVNETVTDNATGLMWQDNSAVTSNSQTWATAGTYCLDLILDSYTDWRLPTAEELTSIANKEVYNPSKFSEFQHIVSSYYWSSTTYVSDPSGAWGVDFSYGNDVWSNKANSIYVRCVRDGE